jgi:hypothetical protein
MEMERLMNWWERDLEPIFVDQNLAFIGSPPEFIQNTKEWAVLSTSGQMSGQKIIFQIKYTKIEKPYWNLQNQQFLT